MSAVTFDEPQSVDFGDFMPKADRGLKVSSKPGNAWRRRQRMKDRDRTRGQDSYEGKTIWYRSRRHPPVDPFDGTELGVGSFGVAEVEELTDLQLVALAQLGDTDVHEMLELHGDVGIVYRDDGTVEVTLLNKPEPECVHEPEPEIDFASMMSQAPHGCTPVEQTVVYAAEGLIHHGFNRGILFEDPEAEIGINPLDGELRPMPSSQAYSLLVA